MRSVTSTFRVLALASFTALSAPAAASAQAAAHDHAAQVTMTKDELTAFARVYIAVAKARDSADVQFAAVRNKTEEAQKRVQEQLQTLIASILQQAGMSTEEYRRKTFVVSSVDSLRNAFEETISQLTGVPRPGQLPPGPPPVVLPPGQAGTHIGHVMNSFADTPDRQGLLPVAVAEARIAAQHAMLAARTPTNLDQMKLHAGHVIHAIDPTIVTMGPGRGYGVKRAALGVATHIELAAKAEGAPAGVVTHSVHVATSARNTMQRADSLVAIAQRIRAATTAPEAAELVSQLASLAGQLIAGTDANADGRITWAAGEGGLQHAEEHVALMLGSVQLAAYSLQ